MITYHEKLQLIERFRNKIINTVYAMHPYANITVRGLDTHISMKVKWYQYGTLYTVDHIFQLFSSIEDSDDDIQCITTNFESELEKFLIKMQKAMFINTRIYLLSGSNEEEEE